MRGILSTIFSNHFHQSTVQQLVERKKAVVSSVGTPLSKAFFLSEVLQQKFCSTYLYIVDNENEIPEYETAFSLFHNTIQIQKLLPKDDALQNQRQILSFMKGLNNKNETEKLFITTPAFIFQEVPSKEIVRQSVYTIQKGEKIILREFYERLISLGYTSSSDAYLKRGQYHIKGGNITLAPIDEQDSIIYQLELANDEIETIYVLDQDTKDIKGEREQIEFHPLSFSHNNTALFEYLPENMLIVGDEISLEDEEKEQVFFRVLAQQKNTFYINITSFPEEKDIFENLRYISVIKYYTVSDFINDIREKYASSWKIVIITKNKQEVASILENDEVIYSTSHSYFKENTKGIILLEADESFVVPRSFQNTKLKISVLTDREIFRVKKKGSMVYQKSALDFITSLKPGDYVVHTDHGIGRFLGIDKKTVDGITREYIDIQYAGNDRLFIPTDQAGKVSRFITGGDDNAPKLTRLDSGEWAVVNKKVKKETEKIAKELLQIYAQRKLVQGTAFLPDTKEQKLFEETFPYEETYGQLQAIKDVKEDMEKPTPMDRLICGDVGFGKTEVALRASFKAVATGKQVAFISPVTILTDQHYKTFTKRMADFNVRISMMSRFRSPAEQRKTLKDLEEGNIDIVIGTHRLLQDDVVFKNLGLVIIDEEQKFGVKQKEKIKKLRASIDILTLTATPIPRTLNMSLNKLKDITTITTPPPGRLPIITEVRKYNDQVVRDAILAELQRKGQIYFLHNKVQTIEGIADKLRFLVPEAKFVVGHGQMDSGTLEEHIMDFKNGKYDVLVSSTIIENGIDFPNANTLIVNNADRFGLSQLYQLRGRVGRGKQQAYTYLLYHGQRLSVEAKKRLRAIVEASELGSGFQIAMKDLEIRGAGDVLGAQQHGVIKTVGASHFIRMLNKTVEDMKAGRYADGVEIQPEQNITVELPLTSYIPETFISDYKEKISVYQKMSTMETLEELLEMRQSLQDEYGALPEETRNLFKVLEVKIMARMAYITAIRIINYTLNDKYLELSMSNKVTPYQVMNLLKDRELGSKWIITGEKLKINIKEFGLDWYEGVKKSLSKLIEGKNKDAVEKKEE